jgi:hypothetical protein
MELELKYRAHFLSAFLAMHHAVSVFCAWKARATRGDCGSRLTQPAMPSRGAVKKIKNVTWDMGRKRRKFSAAAAKRAYYILYFLTKAVIKTQTQDPRPLVFNHGFGRFATRRAQKHRGGGACFQRVYQGSSNQTIYIYIGLYIYRQNRTKRCRLRTNYRAAFTVLGPVA